MSRIHPLRIFFFILLLAALASACGPQLAPARSTGETATPISEPEPTGTDDAGEASNGSVFVDYEPFQAALLQAIQARDEAKLEQLMTENFVSGWWRGEMGDLPRVDALRELYQDQLGEAVKLGVAPGVDLAALMGGINPLDILRPEANVVHAIVVTGWGKDGRDEAILFVSRQPDNSLRWAGTLVIKGGFTSPETGGLQALVKPRHGYQMYIPKGYEVSENPPDGISILAPQGTGGHRTRASITVEPANGRTAEQMAAEMLSDQPAPFANQTATVMGLDTELAMIVDKVPSQDMMRVLFVVHEGRLYRMYFVPNDENEGAAYNQMRSLYAAIVNTFKFIPVEAAPTRPAGGKLIADPAVFIDLLQQALVSRDKVALESMMGADFTLAFWQSEGGRTVPDQAIQQILNNYVPAGAQPVLDPNHPIIPKFFSDRTTNEAGEELTYVHVSGWGLEGKDEAILFIARRADGSLYWQGALTAVGGFEQ